MASTDSNSAVVSEQICPGVVQITLNRPKALNAINVDLLTGLVNILRYYTTSTTASAKVIVITGAGDRSFCAGEDLKQSLAPKTGSAAELRQAFHQLQDLTRLISSSATSAIVIAAVQGFAIGGGAEIALAADFVIGCEKTRFRFPEVAIGHAATGGITARLVQLVGLLKAKELFLTGRFIESEEAMKLGMLTELVKDPKARALDLAKQLAKMPGVSLLANKASVERAVFPCMEAVLQDEVSVANVCFAEDDAAKAFSNFAARKGADKKPESRDINAAFNAAVSGSPNKPFLRFAGNDVTFKEFDFSVSQLAGGLRSIGIAPGDRVMVMMRNSVEMVCTWLATNRLGATWVPVNTELRSVTLKHVLEAAEASIAIVDPDFSNDVKTSGVVHQDSIYVNTTSATDSMKLLSNFYDFPSPVRDAAPVLPSTPAAFLYTSGTTGRSKPCILSHEYFVSQARTLISGCSLTSDDVLYCPFPLFHADATALTVVPAMLLGCTAALAVRFSASNFWNDIRQTRSTVYDFMGATLALTYKQVPSPRDREHNVRIAWGVPLHDSMKGEFEKRFGHKLVTLYGSVEASVPIFQHGDDLPPGSCGRVTDDCEIRIADDEDEPLPVNTPGNLLLRSSSPNRFFSGYFNDATSTLAAYHGLWFHTGDLAKIDEAGNIYFLGRMKDVIRRRGENVNASEVEEEFLAHPDVVIAAAYGIPSSLGDGAEEDVKVAIKLREGCNVKEQELWEWAKQHLARFQVPAVIEIVEDIKRTPTGKIQKHGLSAEGGVRFDGR